MIRVRGFPINADEAAELARRIRAHGDPIGVGVAERLERGILVGTAMVGTTPTEAQVLLAVFDRWIPDRLREVRDSLDEFVSAGRVGTN